MSVYANESGTLKILTEDFSVKGLKLFYTIVPPDSESMGAISNANHRVYNVNTLTDEGIFQVKKFINIPSSFNPSLIIIVRLKEELSPDNSGTNIYINKTPGAKIVIADTSGGSSGAKVGTILPDICCDAMVDNFSSSSGSAAINHPLVRYNSSNHRLEFGQYAYKNINSSGVETTYASNSLNILEKYCLYIFLE